jgi:hypothetical protein
MSQSENWKSLTNYSGNLVKIFLLIFLLSIILENVFFFPTLGEINIWDEANYIHSGYRLLTEGHLPQLVGSPLSSIFYAFTTLPVLHSPNFFVLSDAIGRIVLFSLIFMSVTLIATELKPYTNPWVMIGFIFIVPVASTMFLYPSDVLFAGLAGLAFWQMLAFYRNRESKHLWWASGLMGLATLARAEGLILIGVLLVVTVLIVWKEKGWYRSVIAVLVPFIVLVGGFVLTYGIVTGNFNTGLSDRTYNNFESGQEGIYSQTGIYTPTISARLEAREAFGTPEENNNSVFRAILRNPAVYWERLKRMGFVFRYLVVKAYGNKFVLIFLWLSIRGVIELLRKKHFPLVAMSVLWFLPLGAGVLNTFFREGYFMMPFFVIFFLSGIGLTAIINRLDQRSEQIALVLSALAVLGIGVLLHNTSMLFRNGLFIAGIGLVYLVSRTKPLSENWRSSVLWIMLAMALIIRGGYPSPELPVYGQTDIERSVYVLQDNFPSGSNILAGAPANVWAARMNYFGINSYDIPDFSDSQEFYDWLKIQEVKAVYIDTNFPEYYRSYINDLDGSVLQEIYITPERDILIYRLIEGEL